MRMRVMPWLAKTFSSSRWVAFQGPPPAPFILFVFAQALGIACHRARQVCRPPPHGSGYHGAKPPCGGHKARASSFLALKAAGARSGSRPERRRIVLLGCVKIAVRSAASGLAKDHRYLRPSPFIRGEFLRHAFQFVPQRARIARLVIVDHVSCVPFKR